MQKHNDNLKKILNLANGPLDEKSRKSISKILGEQLKGCGSTTFDRQRILDAVDIIGGRGAFVRFKRTLRG